MKYYLYNKLANNGIELALPKGVQKIDCVGLDYPKFFKELKKEDEVVFVGGDGTINHFVNAVNPKEIKNNVYLLANGSGNDFMNDIEEPLSKEVLLNKYFENLPVVRIKGKEYRYFNNMSFGLDGWCCEEADNIKAKSPNKKINYTTIALKGLLSVFQPRHAWIDVDGQTYEFDDVWLAPAMNGRFVGGGMMIAPNQDRFSDTLTLVIYHCKSKLKSMLLFPSIFKGKHIKHTDVVKTFVGHNIRVRYDKPCAVQIDGNCILDVLEYEAQKH